MHTPALRAILSLSLFLIPVSCGGGGSRTVPISATELPPELVLARAHVNNPFSDSDLLTATASGLAERKLASRNGTESRVRVHPDGNRLVFVRQLRRNDPDSREIFVGTVDQSVPEQRLTSDGVADDTPCWTSDGTAILWSRDVGGRRQIWRMEADGSNAMPLSPITTASDDEPDCIPGLVVFRRTTDRGRLHKMTLSGADLGPLTDGGSAAIGSTDSAGDSEPAIHPGGDRVLFVRHLGPQQCLLMEVSLSTGVVTTRGDGLGEDRYPRWSKTGDRLFVARSRPSEGRPGLRLHALTEQATDPVLLFPDRRFECLGFDLLPTLPAYVAPGTLVDAAYVSGDLRILAGTRTNGSRESLRDSDGQAMGIATSTIQGRELAALLVRLPTTSDPTELADVRIRVTARATRSDPESRLRIAAFHTVLGRYDTIIELPAPTTQSTFEFTLGSLAHVDRSGRLLLEVIADLSAGARAELEIDELTAGIRKKSR